MRKARPWRPVNVCAATAGVDSQVCHSSSAPRFLAQRPRTLAMMASASPQCVRQPAQLYTLAAAPRGGGRRRKDTTPSFPARRAAPATPQLDQHFGRRRLEGPPRGRRAAAEHKREQQVAQLAEALAKHHCRAGVAPAPTGGPASAGRAKPFEPRGARSAAAEWSASVRLEASRQSLGTKSQPPPSERRCDGLRRRRRRGAARRHRSQRARCVPRVAARRHDATPLLLSLRCSRAHARADATPPTQMWACPRRRGCRPRPARLRRKRCASVR